MIAFKTKQPQLIDPFNQVTAIVVAAVSEINVDKLNDMYRLYWSYYIIHPDDGLVKLDKQKPSNLKVYTRQQVMDYHQANSNSKTLLPEIEDAIFFKSLKQQVVDDGILGLVATDWEPHT